MGQQVEITVPDIGDFDAVEVIEVLVSAGDAVEEEQSLITLESDKATMEVPSSHAGTVVEVKISNGDQVAQGDVIALLEVGAAAEAAPAAETAPAAEAGAAPAAALEPAPPAAPAAEAPAPPASAASAPPPAASAAASTAPSQSAGAGSSLDEVDEQAFASAHAAPGVRRLARELGADLGRVEGSGRKGRITKEDVEGYIRRAVEQFQSGRAAAPAGDGNYLPVAPARDIDFSKFGEIEHQPLTRIQKISGPALHRSWVTVPHVTQFDQADITELEAFRKQLKPEAERAGVKVTPVSFLLLACARALKERPRMNSSLAPGGEELIMKKYIHIGVAVDTLGGLVVPVVQDVDQKGIFEISADLMDISQRARDGKLGPRDIQGATFTISSLGGIGGTGFTPVVNSPEVGILGVARHSTQPVWNGSEFEPRLILPFSLSYDHRVIDGAEAVRFTTTLGGILSDLRRILI
ncbi:MAG: 2-oxo acid dehydrogenase subunit E2 [Acidobacteriota bacterium]